MLAPDFRVMTQAEHAQLLHTLADFVSAYAELMAEAGISGEAREAHSAATEARQAACELEVAK